MKGTKTDLTGRRFGRLVVACEGRIKGGARTRVGWACVCDCGATKTIRTDGLIGGRSTSCGCKRIESTRTHGQTGTQMHRLWIQINYRCHNHTNKDWPRYGGRGIAVCERWRNSFDAFLEDMGPRPSPAHSIDREDNSKGYEPGNCRWATDIEQARNKRTTVLNEVAVALMRHMAARGARQDDLAHAFGAHKATIRDAVERITWKAAA